MGIESWKDEFYSEDASEYADKPEIEAVRHSLKKWRGLRLENKNKHGVYLFKSVLTDADNGKLHINAGSCALCMRDETQQKGTQYDSCDLCILQKLGDCCDNENSSYDHFIKTSDPEPMIESLEQAEAELDEQEIDET